MNRRDFLKTTGSFAAALAFVPYQRSYSLLSLPKDDQGRAFAEGVVFNDRNGNGVRDPGEPGIAGVCVSNGREVVRTDADGRWRLPIDNDTILFVIKPSGWAVPVDENQLPRFYYIHKPEGSPKFRYEGVSPTGPLPPSVDFALRPQRESHRFRMVMFGDPQPRNQTEIDYIAHDVVEQVVRDAAAVDAKFGISLGDIMFDVLTLFGSLNRTIGTVGIPWYNVVGNHDLNFDAQTNRLSTETFQRTYGPTDLAFNYGRVHFLILNNIFWNGSMSAGYHAELTDKTLAFVENDLAEVPRDRLVVICMHIPITQIRNRERLFRLFEDRPYTVSFSAHTHVQRHHFLTEEDGWKGLKPHHHVNHVTVCGSWWQGAPDERGIPHATMSDGVPNGYSIVEFDAATYRIQYRPASRPADEQMRIWTPEAVPMIGLASTDVIANVYAGSEKSVVEMRVDGGEWLPMERFTGQDPYYLALKALEAGPNPPPGRRLPNPSSTPHLWKAPLPRGLRPGSRLIEVRTTDMFGQVHTGHRILRVTELTAAVEPHDVYALGTDLGRPAAGSIPV
ncbi:MAG: calcineurin-like phosphoesterase C-terminal domain-containing protein [Fimbriimonadaceae bacterium]